MLMMTMLWGGVTAVCVLQFQSPAGLCKHALQSLGLVILFFFSMFQMKVVQR